MCDHFGALGIKTLICQAYLKGVAYLNTAETKIWNEQKKLWNMKYLYKWKKNLQGNDNVLKTFGPIIHEIKLIQAVYYLQVNLS